MSSKTPSAAAEEPAETPPGLRVDGLTVRRGERVLFAGLDFAVAPGSALLLRGANGVGKSTLLLALAGIVRPDAGQIAGNLPHRLHLLGYQHGLKPRLSVTENLRFWQAMHGATGRAIDDALDAVGIAALAGLETGYLSSGQTRRLALARLLVSARPIWLLDEPSATLDAAGEALLGRLIDDHLGQGGLAVIATHHDLPISAGRVATLGIGSPA